VIIRRVHVRRFRKLLDQVFECGPGLNVIRGPNDAGKSTLHLAFSAALYPVKPSDSRSYGTWGEGDPGEIAVEFEADGRSYRLHKDFRSRRVALQCAGSRWDDPREVERRVGELLGLTSLSLFRATVHISQWDLSGVQKEQQEIGARLARIVTGGDADAVRVLSAIEEKIRKLEVGLRHPSKTPGPLKRDQDRLSALTADQHRLAVEVEAIERAAAERDRLTAQIQELEAQVQGDAALLDANRRLLVLSGRWTELSARAAELRSLLDRITEATREVEVADRDEALSRPAPDTAVLHTLREAEARSQALAASLQDTAALGIPAVPAGRPHPPAPSDRFLRTLGPGVIGLTALLMGVIGAALLAAGRVPWGMGALVLTALLAGAAAVAWLWEKAASGEAAVRAGRQHDLSRQAEERRRAAETAADEVRRQLDTLGVPSVQAALEMTATRQEAVQRQAAAHRLLQSLLGERRVEEVTGEHRRVLLELGMIQTEREDPDVLLKQLDPAGFQRLQAEAEARQKRLAGARGELQRLEGRLSGRSPHEDLARVEEDLAGTRDRLIRHQGLAEVLRLAREIMLEAHRRTIVPGRALLEERAGRYLHELSRGTYDRLVVDEHSLAPRVWVGPPKEWADVASREIGSGAVDQCYLALRLALIDVLCADRRPPLFLDDPFLAYDEDRERAAMRLLCHLARDRQIFLLTCRGDYAGYADHLILLGEVPAPAPAPREPSTVPTIPTA
jgi:DNA repair exonuclease SbcCD ATPase subunit